MSKLLNDEELLEHIKHCTDGQLEYYEYNKSAYSRLIDLINTQKRLYAESVISSDDTVQNEGDTETFKHMLTVLMIMFGDAKECEDADRERSEKLTREAFEYAESWLEVFRAEQRARIK